jgi:hypothetical protein
LTAVQRLLAGRLGSASRPASPARAAREARLERVADGGVPLGVLERAGGTRLGSDVILRTARQLAPALGTLSDASLARIASRVCQRLVDQMGVGAGVAEYSTARAARSAGLAGSRAVDGLVCDGQGGARLLAALQRVLHLMRTDASYENVWHRSRNSKTGARAFARTHMPR